MTTLDQALLALSYELLLLVDPASLCVVAASPNAVRTLGYESGETLCQTPITEIECALSDLFFWEEIRAGERPQAATMEGLYRRLSGEVFPVEKCISSTTVDDRELISIRARVIAEEKAANDELDRTTSLLRATLESTADGILVTDLDGHIINFNRRFASLWSLPDALISKGSDTLIYHSMVRRMRYRSDWRQWIDHVTHAREQETFDTLSLRTGKTLECRSRPQMVRDQMIGRVYTFADITDRLHAQQELEAARDAAESANRAKTDFLNHMSHELRTPLNAIIGFAQLIQQDGAGEHADNVDLILRGGWHLLNLINEVLDLARVESGKMELHIESVNLPELAADCIAFVRPLAEKYEVHLHNDIPAGSAHVKADPLRLRQMLLNLLSNSIKYNRKGGDVWLGSHCTEPGRISISIRDSGIGISDEDQARIFEGFTRVGSKQHSVEGTGIGLAFTRKLARLMEGDISLSSRIGEGSCFRIELPAVAGTHSAPAGQGTSASPHSSHHCNILYIDDEPMNRKLMAGILRRHPGYRLLLADTGEEGIATARAQKPDLIITDLNLGDMSGYDVLNAILADPDLAGTPMFMLSASTLQHEVDAAIEAGFRRYLTKPFNIPELLSAIAEIASDTRPT